ncbi:MAG: hypothetical protein AAB740_01675, partial [Patescibacteria group bacterium]
MKRKKTNKKIFKIFNLILEQIAEVFPYILGFYIACLILSYLFVHWRLFFNWPVFHISVVILGALALLSEKGRRFFLIQRRLIWEKFINF